MTKNNFSLEELSSLISDKISKREKGSYSYELAKSGVEKITRKVGEEALEVVIAAFLNDEKNTKKTRKELIGEVADLFYHSLVLLSSQKIELSEIVKELEKRNKKK